MVFSASLVTQFMANGIAFSGQMLIPIYLIRALAGCSPSAAGWLLAPLGFGNDVLLPVDGNFDEAFWHSQSTSAGGKRSWRLSAHCHFFTWQAMDSSSLVLSHQPSSSEAWV